MYIEFHGVNQNSSIANKFASSSQVSSTNSQDNFQILYRLGTISSECCSGLPVLWILWDFADLLYLLKTFIVIINLRHRDQAKYQKLALVNLSLYIPRRPQAVCLHILQRFMHIMHNLCIIHWIALYILAVSHFASLVFEQSYTTLKVFFQAKLDSKMMGTVNPTLLYLHKFKRYTVGNNISRFKKLCLKLMFEILYRTHMSKILVSWREFFKLPYFNYFSNLIAYNLRWKKGCA